MKSVSARLPHLAATKANHGSAPPGMSKNNVGKLIIVERRMLVRQFLDRWLMELHQTTAVMSVADAEVSLSPEELSVAKMIIIGLGATTLSNSWLERQIDWIRASRSDLPIIVILDADEDLECVVARLDTRLQGCIPTSSSISVAAAAVQLVAAGGLYFPGAERPVAPLVGTVLRNIVRHDSPTSLIGRLTPRERAVLELLEQGMANKIIAYRLSLSQSTVKAHVHSIISKLNVRNRTEAAVRATSSSFKRMAS